LTTGAKIQWRPPRRIQQRTIGSARTRRLVSLVALDLIERHTTIGGIFAREAQHAFADDVAGDLGGAATEAAVCRDK
jgi:hypothetical protein